MLVKACKDPSGVAMVTENSGKNIIFSRSGKEVRECCITSGKISILPQLREKSGRFGFLLATKFDKDFFIVGKVMLLACKQKSSTKNPDKVTSFTIFFSCQ